MMLWIALAILAAIAAIFMAAPFLKAPTNAEAAASNDILNAQLDEIAREEAAGELDAETAAALRLEMQRRILNTPAEPHYRTSATIDRATAVAVSAVVVVGAIALYALTGSPGTQSTQTGTTMQRLPEVDVMIEALRQRLERSPDDAEGWRMLGWSYFETGDFDGAASAYARAVALAPMEGEYRSAYGEALTWANDTQVPPAALEQFRTALARTPNDERARYYLALAKAQAGDGRGAVRDWLAALRDAAPGSEWRARMRADAENIAQQAGIDISAQLPPEPEQIAPTSPPHPLVGDTSVADPQQAMIQGMVDRLDQRLGQNPNDIEGWERLIRSRMVLGETDRARDALGRALDVYRGDNANSRRLRALASSIGLSET